MPTVTQKAKMRIAADPQLMAALKNRAVAQGGDGGDGGGNS